MFYIDIIPNPFYQGESGQKSLSFGEGFRVRSKIKNHPIPIKLE
jgi:hypothetical protein